MFSEQIPTAIEHRTIPYGQKGCQYNDHREIFNFVANQKTAFFVSTNHRAQKVPGERGGVRGRERKRIICPKKERELTLRKPSTL